MANLLIIEPIFFVILSLALITCDAATYNVGDGAGWDISADLPSWIANKMFYVGDALLFQYSSYHTLNEVDKSGYDNCNATDALLTGANGNTTVPLTAAGEKYFICGIPSHCFGGMKLQVDVLAGNATGPAPSPLSQSTPAGVQSGSPTENNNLSPPAANGFLHGVVRSPRIEVWLCTTGALLWAILIGM